MQTSDVLNTAADLIEKRGWVSAAVSEPGADLWGSRTEDGPICIEGGIMAALGLPFANDDLTDCGAYQAVWNYLQNDTRWGLFRSRLFDWNDTPDRTAAEVIEVLRATAVIEAAKEEADERVTA